MTNSSSLGGSYFAQCSKNINNTLMSLAFLLFTLLILLPLYVWVVHLAIVRRRTRPGDTATHSDLFTFHLIPLEAVSSVGVTLYLIGRCTVDVMTTKVGLLVYALGIPGRPLFHCCTCVERYLAVVHPIRYLGLKGGGARVWHVAAGCVWLLSFGWIGYFLWIFPDMPYTLYFILFSIAFLIISLCCFLVLRALIRPGPGEGGRVDQSKRRAFWTIATILVALTVNILGNLVLSFLQFWDVMSHEVACLVFSIAAFCVVPSCVVQPLLFLRGFGKLPGCRRT